MTEASRNLPGRVMIARWLRWSALGACALILLIYVLTVGDIYYFHSATTGHRYVVRVACGAGRVSVDCWPVKWIDFPWGPAECGWHPAYRFPWLPSYEWSDQGVGIELPLWLPLLLCAGVALLARSYSGRAAPGRCEQCDYDLTGNTSGICPECGCATKSLGKEDRAVGP